MKKSICFIWLFPLLYCYPIHAETPTKIPIVKISKTRKVLKIVGIATAVLVAIHASIML